MSYTYELKKEFIKRKNSACCSKATLFGFLNFSGTPFPDYPLKISLEQPELFAYLKAAAEGVLKQEISEIRNEGNIFLPEKADRDQLVERLKFGEKTFERYLQGKDCCKKSLLRGAFLACGHLSSPEKRRHLEFACRDQTSAENLIRLLKVLNLPAKMTLRSGSFVVYIKSGEIIRDFLAETGSTEQFFDFTNVAIVKSLRNSVNRQVNCENANIDKTVQAAAKHRKAIRTLFAAEVPLPDPSREIAELRIGNPEASLEQLGKMCTPPLSKAGVNHRLEKLCRLAGEIEKDNLGKQENKKGKP